MVEIKNITFDEYLHLPDDERATFDFYIKYSELFNKPVDHYGIGDFDKLKFGIVKDVQQELFKPLTYGKMIEVIELITKKPQKELYNEYLLNLLQVKNYIVSEIERITEIETIALQHEEDPEEDALNEQAGIEKYNALGVYNQIRSLMDKDVTKFESVRNTTYEICFLELYARKLDAEFLSNKQKIIERKYKR